MSPTIHLESRVTSPFDFYMNKMFLEVAAFQKSETFLKHIVCNVALLGCIYKHSVRKCKRIKISLYFVIARDSKLKIHQKL